MEHNYARYLDLELNARIKQSMTRSIEYESDALTKEAPKSSFLGESMSFLQQHPTTMSVSRAQIGKKYSTVTRSISSQAGYSETQTRA